MYNILLIGLAFLLVLLNAFFVAAEFSMVKLRATKVQEIKEQYGLRGKLLEKIHAKLDAYLSACQLGITLASLGLGWIGEPAFAYILVPLFHLVGIHSTSFIEVSSFFIAFFIISYLHIVVGELMPKSVAIRRAEFISIWTAVPLYFFYKLMYPAIWLLNSCSNAILHKLGLNVEKSEEGFYTTDELKLILNSSHTHGELDQDEKEMLKNALDLAELKVTDIMRTKEHMVILDTRDSREIIEQKIIQNKYSRYPVYDHQQKKIIGFIHVKDLFPDLLTKKEITNLALYVRPVLNVAPNLPAMDLLQKFRRGMPHFALVYKNSSTLWGFITLDDLLHILFGRIKDEFHRTHDDWTKNEDNTYSFRGTSSIYSLERALDCEISLYPNEEELNSLNGLLIARNGSLPHEGQSIHFEEFDALVEKIDQSFIESIKITPNKGTQSPV
ncbi:hemolysin family protein [Legionella sp. km772]|uniref:hemolysin family protein n=1 Tax=Legionella sp. km772 TaxID=2498111 RepID=UPI000F8F7281|nr:hemolysin family protein [Legionella sp. km772]RUR08416.1 HlyC/CorC family transporter [Legionella sp. km772]